MSTSITETAEHGGLPSLRPDDLDDAYMDGGPSPLWPIFQEVINRGAFALLGVSAALHWSQFLAVEPSGTASSFSITVGAIQAAVIVAEDGSSYGVYFYAGGSITQTKLEGGGSLSGDTPYYVYAKPGSGGICDFEISATAPRAGRQYKNTAGYAGQSRRYLGSFVTDTSGNPLPGTWSRGRFTFRRSAIATVEGDGTVGASFAGGGLRALTRNSAQATKTDLGLSLRVPPTARAVLLRLKAIGDVTPFPATLSLYADTDTASPGWFAYSINDAHSIVEVEVPLAAGSRVVKYTLAGSGLLNGYVDLLGYVE